MAERVARTQGREASHAGQARPPAHGAKHCWVQTEHGREPGLLLEWKRRTEHGVWEGRVLYPKLVGDEWAVLEEWLPGGMLTSARPADE